MLVHHREELLPALGHACRLCEKHDRLLDLGEIPRALADDDGKPRFTKRRHDGEIPPVRHDDEIGRECDEFFNCRIADALFHLLRKLHNIRAYGIVEEAVYRCHILGRHETEHDLVRAHRKRDNAMRLCRQGDDRPLAVRDRIASCAALCRLRHCTACRQQQADDDYD